MIRWNCSALAVVPFVASLLCSLHYQIEPPLSSVEVGEISEIVRVEQKKLLESAPTEWNSGLRRTMRGRRKGGAGNSDVVMQGDIAQGEFLGGSSGGDGDIDYDDEDDEDYDEGEDYMTSLGLLHRLLLAEMRGEGTSGGLNNRWIDRDALLQVSRSSKCCTS